MVVLLPRKLGQLADLEKLLTAADIHRAIANLQVRSGSVFIPRFKMILRVALKENLNKMGMPLAFSDRADFSGIAPARGLKISDVFHKAFIEVEEEGTEAAAATAVVFGGRSSIGPFLFRADHPFLFLIREQQTGSILFLGRVSDPLA